jgi:hypothetical protein
MRPPKIPTLLATLCALCWPSAAAEIWRDGARIHLSGPIRAGDVQRLLDLHPEMNEVVSLSSNGGDFQEGLRLARIFSDTYLQTVVEADNACLSSCAFAFLGGTFQSGEDGAIFPGRSIAPTARLGFHAPYLNLENGEYSKMLVEGAYDRATASIVDAVQAADVMQIEPADLAELLRPQREKLTYIATAGQLSVYRIALQGVAMPARLTQTMAVSLCANGWRWSGNYKRDRDGYTGVDAFQAHEAIVADLDWTAAGATMTITDGGSPKVVTAVPLMGGSEGTITFCLVSQSQDAGQRTVLCDGFIRLESASEALEWVKDGVAPEYPCPVNLAVDPTRGTGHAYGDVAYALVPPETPLALIGATLEVLARMEKAIPAP